jgi:tetratricopeptide (TPR) repeat protein
MRRPVTKSKPTLTGAATPVVLRLRFPAWLIAILLVLVTILAYQPVWHAGFIWDDDDYITNNLTLHSLAGLRQIWFEPGATIQYYPLTFTTFWVEYHLWGLNPLGYHLVNVLLHACNAVLIWVILRKLRVPGAWLAAGVFALHPVGVESVAWVTERKNTLSGLFYLVSILAALKFWLPGETVSESHIARPQNDSTTSFVSWKFYWLAFAFYVCALCSKTTTLPLPAVILLLVWWKRGRIVWRDVYPLGLFLAAGIAMGMVTMNVETHEGSLGKEWGYSWLWRCLLAGRDVWFYLGKLFWPQSLIPIYPHWTIRTSEWTEYVPLIALVVGLAILWWKRAGWGRPLLVTFAYFVPLLFLVLGFFEVSYFWYSFVADHFQYLASIGPLALASAGITMAFGFLGKRNLWLKPVFCGALLLTLGVLTWRQSGIYTNAETLWRTTIDRNPVCWLAYYNLGTIQIQNGKATDAINQFQRALRIKPDYAEAHNNLGTALFQNGQTDEAIANLQQAVAIWPGYAEAHNNLGTALLQKGEADEAIIHFQSALAIRPNYAKAHYNFGNALIKKGQLGEAINQYEQSLAIQPGFIETQSVIAQIAWVLATSPDPSVRNGTKAVELAQQMDQLSGGGNPVVVTTLAAAFAEMGRFPEAITTAQRALELAASQNNTALVAALEAQIKLYQTGSPFHQTAPRTDK